MAAPHRTGGKSPLYTPQPGLLGQCGLRGGQVGHCRQPGRGRGAGSWETPKNSYSFIQAGQAPTCKPAGSGNFQFA